MSPEHPITLQWLVDKTSTVYSHPLFYERLNEAINHPRSSVADIARIITEDQGLTARILRLANSPMFGYFGRIDSINRAVTIIGTQQLRDLALAASVMGVFTGIPDELINMAFFWRHSIACGIIARSVAEYLRGNNVERLFVAGILHDIGQLVLCTTVPAIARQVLEQSREQRELFFQTERTVLGFDHAELGGALLREWKIPANIIDPVTWHHQPQRAEQFPLEAAIVHLADIVCQALALGGSGEWCVPPLDPSAWERIGMPVTMLTTIVRQAEPIIEETFAILTETH